MKVTLLTKKTRGASVHAVVRLHFGDVESLKNQDIPAILAGRLLMRGTSSKNRQQIQDEIDRVKAQINIAGSATGANATVETTRENLPAALRLVAEMFKDSVFPENEFEEVRKEQLHQSGFRTDGASSSRRHTVATDSLPLSEGRRPGDDVAGRPRRRVEVGQVRRGEGILQTLLWCVPFGDGGRR